MPFTDLTGRWIGHYLQRGQEHPITADLIQAGEHLSGSMRDGHSDSEYSVFEVAFEAGLPPGADEQIEANVRALVPGAPAGPIRYVSHLPTDSVLEGRRTGNTVSFLKTYQGTSFGGFRVGNQLLGNEKAGHAVHYEGRLSSDGHVIEGKWWIDPDPAYATRRTEGLFTLRCLEVALMSPVNDPDSQNPGDKQPVHEPCAVPLTRDPACLSAGTKFVHSIGLTMLVLVAVMITAVGAYASTIWLSDAGVRGARNIQLLVVLPVVGLSVLVFIGGKAGLDRAVIGSSRLRQERPEHLNLSSPSRLNEPLEAGPVPPARSKLERFKAFLIVLIALFGTAIFFWNTLLPLFSYEVRKSRMEAAVVRLLDKEGPERPLKPLVDLMQKENGEWLGTAMIGEYRYNIKAHVVGRDLSVEWRRAN